MLTKHIITIGDLKKVLGHLSNANLVVVCLPGGAFYGADGSTADVGPKILTFNPDGVVTACLTVGVEGK